MRILAIDYGTRRMGIAVSDDLAMLAHPLEFIPAEPHAAFLARLREILVSRGVGLILVGMPRNMDGSHGPASVRVQAFVEALRTEVDVAVRTMDERLTTVAAHRALDLAQVRGPQRRGKVDQMAAAILLQNYLDAAAWRKDLPDASA